MDVFEAIFRRQSISKVKPDPLPRTLIEEALSAAVQAPNHHRVRPWRFFVVEGEARQRLGDVMAQVLSQRKPEIPSEALAVERAKPLRAPLLIAVGVDKPIEPKVQEIENVCAAAAAVQNLLLALHAQGLGAIWRTGAAVEEPLVKAFFGLAPDQRLIGFLYAGYPEADHAPKERPGFADRTTWLR
jgi:nitroreductase